MATESLDSATSTVASVWWFAFLTLFFIALHRGVGGDPTAYVAFGFAACVASALLLDFYKRIAVKRVLRDVVQASSDMRSVKIRDLYKVINHLGTLGLGRMRPVLTLGQFFTLTLRSPTPSLEEKTKIHEFRTVLECVKCIDLSEAASLSVDLGHAVFGIVETLYSTGVPTTPGKGTEYLDVFNNPLNHLSSDHAGEAHLSAFLVRNGLFTIR